LDEAASPCAVVLRPGSWNGHFVAGELPGKNPLGADAGQWWHVAFYGFAPQPNGETEGPPLANGRAGWLRRRDRPRPAF